MVRQSASWVLDRKRSLSHTLSSWKLALDYLIYLMVCFEPTTAFFITQQDTTTTCAMRNCERTTTCTTNHPTATIIYQRKRRRRSHFFSSRSTTRRRRTTTTSLNSLVNVPDGFFTVTFAGLGLTLALAKNFARIRMEENAWEQRLAEARKERLERDPSLTELDLRRQEASMEWSAYGKPRMDEEAARQAQREADQAEERVRGGRRSRVRTMNRDDDYDDDEEGNDSYDYDNEEDVPRSHRMSEQEIDAFELEYGIDYDPYYDDPYTEDELPLGNYRQDKTYGDRTYETGETFFKDKTSGLYYRQGAKPRNISFWS